MENRVHPKRDAIDYDGMGDFSRFWSRNLPENKSLENEIRDRCLKLIRVFMPNNKAKN